MKNTTIEARVLEGAHYIISRKATVRQTAKALGVSRSTVHNDMVKRLPSIDHEKALAVRSVFETNLKERPYRGGQATRLRWLRLRAAKQEASRA